jgi:hypothetical protein
LAGQIGEYIPPVSRSTKIRSMIPKKYSKAKTLDDLDGSFSGVYKWIYSPNEVVNCNKDRE